MEGQAHTKKSEPIVVGGNQPTTSAVSSTWHFRHVGNQFCITGYTCSLMQLINDFEKIMVKSPGRELSSAFGTSKDWGALLG